jgi:primosomal protein N' (replication factor Y)
MSRITYFVDVILPLSVPNLYTYRVPFEMNADIAMGKRVVVQFGKGKLYSALVRGVHENPPQQYAAKYIDSILDELPVVTTSQFELWDWISNYYMCNIGDVMVAALPDGLKLSSETKIILNPKFSSEQLKSDKTLLQSISDKEYLIIDALEIQNVLSLDDASKILEQKTVYPIIKLLVEKEIVLIQEELKEKFKPKIETFIRLTEYANDENNLKTIFAQVEKKAHKQLDVLMAYIKLANRYAKSEGDVNYINTEIKKSAIVKLVEGSAQAINALIKKNIFEANERETGRLADFNKATKSFELNALQTQVLESIQQSFYGNGKQDKQNLKDVVLLHGVTSSGKTEIYIKLIEQTLAQGKQVLYLLPEIALTTQIINRLRKYFGDKVGVYHSKFNTNERVEVWNSVLNSGRETKNKENNYGAKSFKLIVGARSALFLPFSNIGLIIVDEEHDSSFKQYDPAPRYNARDTAIYLAHLHGAKTLLGSATPSIESYYNAQEGKYGFVEIHERFGGVQMPEVVISDVKEAKKKKMMKSHFTTLFLDTIKQALHDKEQVILFQNRRGFAPQLECNTCAWVPQCTNCDVSLTYHKNVNLLRCHYCGYSTKPPVKCAACGDSKLQMKGFGTEKIEEELAIFFPEASIARMDLDTTRSKFAYQHIIQDFEDQKVNILVGTQMVTKGLDFDNVAVVGIVNADSMLNFPDFRSFERSYQLMAQVSGRAGRKNKRGKVIIQTQNPDHSIIQDVVNNNYLSMYTSQLLDRKNFNYPPFFRLIEFTIIHKDLDLVNNASKYLADELKHIFQKRVLGPEFPLVSRVRNLYRKNILLKIERENSVVQVKKVMLGVLVKFKNTDAYKAVKVQIDVDPL